MTVCDYDSPTPLVSVYSYANAMQVARVGMETTAPTHAINYSVLASLSGMAKTPQTLSDFVAKNFSALANVQAVLAGESGDVLHVWVMIRDWTPEARKEIYAIQRRVLKQLRGFNFDFYVIDLLEGTKPEESVSGIPVIFNRAEQKPASAHRAEQ